MQTAQDIENRNHILVVDDEVMVARFLKDLLSLKGYHVTSFTHSPDAFEFFREHAASIDLVITDQTMPDITGLELARNILAIKPDTAILLASGYSEEVDEEKALQSGIRAYLDKPFNTGLLLKLISKILNDSARQN